MREQRSKIWQRVYTLVKRIPRGYVITYGELARMLRLPGGARAAGWAMGACPSGQGIPWQRVVGAGGRILLQEPRASLQQRLLEAEGTQFVGKRVDIARHHWRGAARKARSRRR